MVNLTKRMHRLMPQLWRVKGGAGAAILPPRPPAPQLTKVVLRLPNPANGYDYGAHSFWRNFLPGLRYHNLTLPIEVEQVLDAKPDYAPTLTLQFEATTQEALQNQKTEPRYTDQQSIQKWHDELAQKHAKEKSAETKGGAAARRNKNSPVAQLREQQQAIGIPKEYATKIGEITTKAQPAADPSTPSTTSPPTTLYQRSITLGLRGRYALDIWRWFQGVTGARPYKLNKDERAGKLRHARHRERAEVERERVKSGIDAMRREKEDLRRAKEAAEKLTEA